LEIGSGEHTQQINWSSVQKLDAVHKQDTDK
jgi:hypothetical protein